MPRWVAEAVSVPLAAQVACTPVVAAISGQVSLVAVGGQPAGRAGRRAGDRARAGRRAARPGVDARSGRRSRHRRRGRRRGSSPSPAGARRCRRPRWSWGDRTGAAGAAHPGCAWLAVPLAPAAARAAGHGAGLHGLLLVVMLLARPPTPGWPPTGWVLAVCDVGQGDGLVLRAGAGRGGGGRRRPRPAPDRRVPRPARASRPCRWWCSRTSTPTTSTGWRACSRAGEVGAVEVTGAARPARRAPRGGAARSARDARSWRRTA